MLWPKKIYLDQVIPGDSNIDEDEVIADTTIRYEALATDRILWVAMVLFYVILFPLLWFRLDIGLLNKSIIMLLIFHSVANALAQPSYRYLLWRSSDSMRPPLKDKVYFMYTFKTEISTEKLGFPLYPTHSEMVISFLSGMLVPISISFCIIALDYYSRVFLGSLNQEMLQIIGWALLVFVILLFKAATDRFASYGESFIRNILQTTKQGGLFVNQPQNQE